MNLPDTRERQEVEPWLYWLSSVLGVVLMITVLATVVLHVVCKEVFPKPADVEAALLFGFGILLVALFNLPWAKVRIGDLEIERAIQEQSQEYAEEIERLEKAIQQYEAILETSKETPPEVMEAITESKHLRAQSDADEDLLIRFLEKWPSWGFTATRIKNWGGDKAEFSRLKALDISRLRSLANEAVGKGKIRTRISRNGNVLYQAKEG